MEFGFFRAKSTTVNFHHNIKHNFSFTSFKKNLFLSYTFEDMKKLFTILLVFALIAGSCNNSGYENAATALESGREFIDGCLKGDFKKASFYMIDDEINQSDLLKIKRDYDTKSSDQKHDYATASIIINSDETIDDLTHIINYAASYDKVAHKVKVINRNGKWLVDFKYTFNGNL
jgi:hypothetical protein